MLATDMFTFQLFVAGDTPNSVQALRNLAALCDSHLPGRHKIEVVDVLIEPMRAFAEGVLLTPTLVKLAPGPSRKIVGSLSSLPTLLQALGLDDLVC